MTGRRQKRWGEPNPPGAVPAGPPGPPGPPGSGTGEVTDHGALTGRGDDDHPQYLTAGRGDARYDALGAAAAASAGDRDRANHTGTQLAATISDFNAAADARVALLVDAAPGTLDTLNELAAALGDDPNFATTTAATLATKLNASAVSAFGLTLLDDADAATARTTLGLGTAATTASTDYATAAQGAKADTAMQPPTRKTLAATHTNSTTTLATITDGTTPWDIPVVAGKTYRVKVIGTHYPAVNTTGIRLSLVGAGGAAGTIRGSIYASIEQSSVATELKAVLCNLSGATGAQVLTTGGTANTEFPNAHGMEFMFICTTSGTLSIQFASQVAGSDVTISAGSTLLIEEV